MVLLVVATWEVCATRQAATSVPDDVAWDAAARTVRAAFRPGDLIVFAPAWNDPVGRLHLGDLISIGDAARMDAAKYGRIWELAIRDAHAPEVDGLVASFARDEGGIAVRRYDRSPAVVLADLRDRVAGTRLEGNRSKGPVVELAEVGFAPHRCILVVPTPNEPVSITFPGVPLGRELVGYAGIADVFTRRDDRVPGRLQVAIDDVVIADTHLGVDDGWVRFAAPTTPGTGDVTIVVSADASNRQICFAAETRR
ncbi:MAG: hypothetical protein NT062_19485 [Proteobacteria bacterium]|nr:hypothetical protein [Pseudomonadota bacterium]